MKDFVENLSRDLESPQGTFAATLQSKASEAGIDIPEVVVQNIAVDEEIKISTQSSVAVNFVKAISIPIQNFESLNDGDIDSVVSALPKILLSTACVSQCSISLSNTCIDAPMLNPSTNQPTDSSVTSCEVSFVNAVRKSLSIGSARRLIVARLLSSEILSLSYEFNVIVDCPASGCNVDSISEALQDAASQDLTAAIESGQFMDTLSAETGNATATISGQVTLDDSTCTSHSQATGGSTSSTIPSSFEWYPSWGGTDKCTNASGMPTYMRENLHYLSSCKFYLNPKAMIVPALTYDIK